MQGSDVTAEGIRAQLKQFLTDVVDVQGSASSFKVNIFEEIT